MVIGSATRSWSEADRRQWGKDMARADSYRRGASWRVVAYVQAVLLIVSALGMPSVALAAPADFPVSQSTVEKPQSKVRQPRPTADPSYPPHPSRRLDLS